MIDFEKEYKQIFSEISSMTEFICNHEDVIDENNDKICQLCGEILEKNINSFTKNIPLDLSNEDI